MRESFHFMYDNVHSKDMGVYMGTKQGGNYEEIFLPSTNIVERQISGRSRPYLQKVEREPLSFSFTIFFEDDPYKTKSREIARWLYVDTYRPLIFESNPDRVFYAMVERDSTLTHTGNEGGYIEITMKCDSPYAYSKEYTMSNLKFRDADKGVTLSLDSSNFDQGEYNGTKKTSNGVALGETIIETWEQLENNHSIWRDLE